MANKNISENKIYVNKYKIMEFIGEVFFNMLIKNTTNIVKFIGYGLSEESNNIEFRIILQLM